MPGPPTPSCPTGKPRWTYQPRNAIDSNAIAIEGERLFLIDGLAAAEVYANVRRGVGTKPPPSLALFELSGPITPRTSPLPKLDLSLVVCTAWP